MTDGRTRALQRRYRETGDVQDGVAWIRSWQREGTLELKRLELAALVGDPLARATIERPDDMGQVLSWSQSDDYWEGFVLDLSYSHHYWDVEQTTVHRACDACDGRGEVFDVNQLAYESWDCPTCRGEGTVEELTEPKSAARDELLFRACIAVARECQKDRMQEWQGQGLAIDHMIDAAAAWRINPDEGNEDYLRRSNNLIYNAALADATQRWRETDAYHTAEVVTRFWTACPRWARFDRFLTLLPAGFSTSPTFSTVAGATIQTPPPVPVSMVHDEITVNVTPDLTLFQPQAGFAAFTLLNPLSNVSNPNWTDVALSLLRAANKARSIPDPSSEKDLWEERLRAALRSVFVPLLLA